VKEVGGDQCVCVGQLTVVEDQLLGNIEDARAVVVVM
jgi:hypothetical protein